MKPYFWVELPPADRLRVSEHAMDANNWAFSKRISDAPKPKREKAPAANKRKVERCRLTQ